MAAEVVKSELLPSKGQERITIMDDYGTEFHLYVPVSAPASREHRITAALIQQNGGQAALEAYASAHDIDLSAHKEAGLFKKTKAKKGTK